MLAPSEDGNTQPEDQTMKIPRRYQITVFFLPVPDGTTKTGFPYRAIESCIHPSHYVNYLPKMETTNEEICLCIPRPRSPSRRRPPAACTGWLHQLPGKPHRYPRCSRLCRSVFCFGARPHQSQAPFFQITRHKQTLAKPQGFSPLPRPFFQDSAPSKNPTARSI
jgi:hypothetical protein